MLWLLSWNSGSSRSLNAYDPISLNTIQCPRDCLFSIQKHKQCFDTVFTELCRLCKCDEYFCTLLFHSFFLWWSPPTGKEWPTFSLPSSWFIAFQGNSLLFFFHTNMTAINKECNMNPFMSEVVANRGEVQLTFSVNTPFSVLYFLTVWTQGDNFLDSFQVFYLWASPCIICAPIWIWMYACVCVSGGLLPVPVIRSRDQCCQASHKYR